MATEKKQMTHPIDNTKGRYYDVPDGANHHCMECGREGKSNTFYLAITPNGSRGVFCRPEYSKGEFGYCLDPDWMKEFAVYRGMATDEDSSLSWCMLLSSRSLSKE